MAKINTDEESFRKGYKKAGKKTLVNAFQRRYRQDLINGKIDQECLIISKNLAR